SFLNKAFTHGNGLNQILQRQHHDPSPPSTDCSPADIAQFISSKTVLGPILNNVFNDAVTLPALALIQQRFFNPVDGMKTA
ncbi:hypothetical protein, partial [Thiolapillus sp.]